MARLLATPTVLAALVALAGFAMPTQAFGQFAVTKISPATQTVSVGTNFDASIVISEPGGGYVISGIEAWVSFDASKLQAVALTTGGSSPFTNVSISQIDNANGTIRYKATGGNISGLSFTAATISFTAIAGGTSAIDIANINTDIVGYGPFGVNGLAVDGSVTIEAPLPTQTLTILGGSGLSGEIAPNTEYYNPGTGEWQPAYLTGGHPWGVISGTNSWINYRPTSQSDPDVSTDPANPTWYLYRVRFNAPANVENAKMTFSLKADNYAAVAFNGVSVGAVVAGQADGLNADLVFSQNLQAGENTITIDVGDFGGLNGMNFRIDLSVQSEEPLEVVPVDVDTTPPVITAPADITAEATGPAGAAVSFSATAVDDVDGPVAVAASPASGSTFAIGTTSVGLAAGDVAGNTAVASFAVTVQDTTAPALVVPGAQTVEVTSPAGATATFSASATDAVGVTSLDYSVASGTTFPMGVSTVDVTAADAAGNTTTQSFSVAVVDTTPPELVLPANQTVEATSAAGAVATFAASASDAYGIASVDYSTDSGSTFPLGTTTVTVTANDQAGLSTSGSFTVTVVDTTAPVLTSVVPSSATLWSPNHKMVPISIQAAGTDLVGISSLKIVSVTSSEPGNGKGDGNTAADIQITGDLTVNLRAERGGKGSGRVYTIEVEAQDAAGNVTTATCTVTVPKSQGK